MTGKRGSEERETGRGVPPPAAGQTLTKNSPATGMVKLLVGQSSSGPRGVRGGLGLLAVSAIRLTTLLTVALVVTGTKNIITMLALFHLMLSIPFTTQLTTRLTIPLTTHISTLIIHRG